MYIKICCANGAINYIAFCSDIFQMRQRFSQVKPAYIWAALMQYVMMTPSRTQILRREGKDTLITG